MGEPDRDRTAAAAARSRALAARLADTAEDLANTLERAAELHDAIAGDEGHPLHAEAADHAAAERAVAAHERRESSRLRTSSEER